MMSRRNFIAGMVACVGSVAFGKDAIEGEGVSLKSPTQLVPLGKTGIKASFVGVGTGMRGWMRSSNHTRMGKEAFIRLIKHAYESGITFYDVADLYGTHTFLRDAVKGIPRENIVIQSKIWFRKEGLPEQVTDASEALERFRKELDTDYIDIVLLHCTTDANWLDQLKRMREQLSEAKEKGIIRAHGTSSHSIDALKASLQSDWVDVQLARINHVGSHMDGKPEEVSDLLRKMRSVGKGVIGMKIFGEGTFKTPQMREGSLRFILEQRCVDAIVIGFERPSEIDETLKMIGTLLGSSQ
jgi:aryl-alcohol dehydrogenase-like predicted oxidoreductase